MELNLRNQLIVSLQMETENVPDRSDNNSVSTGPQYEADRYGTDHKAIQMVSTW